MQVNYHLNTIHSEVNDDRRVTLYIESKQYLEHLLAYAIVVSNIFPHDIEAKTSIQRHIFEVLVLFEKTKNSSDEIAKYIVATQTMKNTVSEIQKTLQNRKDSSLSQESKIVLERELHALQAHADSLSLQLRSKTMPQIKRAISLRADVAELQYNIHKAQKLLQQISETKPLHIHAENAQQIAIAYNGAASNIINNQTQSNVQKIAHSTLSTIGIAALRGASFGTVKAIYTHGLSLHHILCGAITGGVRGAATAGTYAALAQYSSSTKQASIISSIISLGVSYASLQMTGLAMKHIFQISENIDPILSNKATSTPASTNHNDVFAQTNILDQAMTHKAIKDGSTLYSNAHAAKTIFERIISSLPMIMSSGIASSGLSSTKIPHSSPSTPLMEVVTSTIGHNLHKLKV